MNFKKMISTEKKRKQVMGSCGGLEGGDREASQVLSQQVTYEKPAMGETFPGRRKCQVQNSGKWLGTPDRWSSWNVADAGGVAILPSIIP